MTRAPAQVLLFEDRRRTDPAPAGHLEQRFTFLDRAASPYWAEVRRTLNAWFAGYPAHEREELRARLYADDVTSHAAFWELLLHELYRAAGFAIEIHPRLEDTDKRPDFLISRNGASFLLEARVVSGESDEARQRDRRQRALYEAIDRATPEAFYVHLEILTEGHQQPPAMEITTRLEGWLASLNPDAVTAHAWRASRFEDLPTLEFKLRGWKLRFHALPVDEHRRGDLDGPMLGVLPAQTMMLDPKQAVRRAMAVKSSRYGHSTYPLVIALAIDQVHVDEEDIASALCGSTVAELAGDLPIVVNEYRKHDGSFRPDRGRRVSGVLTIATPRPWTAGRLEPLMWLNPWTELPFVGERLWAWRELDPKTNAFRGGQATTSTATLLDLAPDWPPGAPFPT